MKIIALQKFYESLIYFGFTGTNSTFNQLTRLKHYLEYIGPLGYSYNFSERYTTFYDSTENLPLDNTLPVSPNHAGNSFPNTLMIDRCVYNYILNKKIQHVP